MKLDNLGETLKREFARNKKQTMVLGALSLVAIYFWAPLVMKFFRSEESSESATAAVVVVASPTTTPTTAGANAGPTVPVVNNAAWDRVVNWIESDPRAVPALYPIGGRDPFVNLAEPPVETVTVADPPPPVESLVPDVPPQTPEELGYRLSSTVIGPRTRVARINGNSYREGEWIVRETDSPADRVARNFSSDAAESLAFQVRRIHSDHVCLWRDEQEYKLSITPAADRPSSGKIEIYPYTSVE